MSYPQLSKEIWKLINSIDWNDKSFSLEKSYLSSIFSYLAYLHIPEWELKDNKRVKIVPCDEYQRIVNTGTTTDIRNILQDMDIGEVFVVQRRYAVVIGVKAKNVIFVALRGTKELYDWTYNLRATRYEYRKDPHIFFHKGFYKAVSSSFSPISDELRNYTDGDIPIYVTGHSLGGAMAAIFNAVWSLYPIFGTRLAHIRSRYGVFPHSCYTFGMPRYGNLQAMELPQPYHLYNDQDIVPNVPPRWWGFEDSPTEYMLNGNGIERKSQRDSLTFANWIYKLGSGKGITHHSMELYMERLKSNLP